MIHEKFYVLLISWVVIGFIFYVLYFYLHEDEGQDSPFIKKLSRGKRILCRLGIIFLWPVWFPLSVAYLLIIGTFTIIRSIFL